MIKTDSEPFLSFNKNSDFITGVDTENVIEYTNGDVTTYTLRLYTQTDDFNNFTNGIVKSQNGEVATYIYRYIPSAKYVIQKSLSQDDFITYDGLLQLLNTDGSLITEQEIEDGVSKRTTTGCEPSIVASGGRWRCAAGNQHPPSQCVAINPDGICDACGTEWIVWELSTVHPCSSGGGSTGNTGNNNPYGDGGGSGSGHNDNNNTNDNSSSEDNAPVLPTEPIFGSDNEMGIEDHFNQYLCLNNQMDINDINWAYGNHAEASELWNYIYANFTSNDESDCVVIDFEDRIIIENNVPDCVKNIINDLKADDQYIDLGDMPNEVKQELNLSGFILDIFANSDLYNVTFKVEDLEPNSQGQIKNADTDAVRDPNNPLNINFVITLDSSYVENATDLAITRSIIHESVHAYISFIYQTEMFNELSNSLRHLIDQNEGPDQNAPQHILMTQRFVNNIANSIENWDNSSLNDNEYYNYLSWSGGMLATSAFEALSEDYQQAIIDANVAEGNAGPDGEHSNQSQGEKNCN